MGTAGSLTRRFRRLLVLTALAIVGAFAFAGLANAAPPQALLNSDTVTGGASSREAVDAAADGFAVTTVTGAQWDAMSAAQFAQYQLLIIGDPTCGTVATSATSNANVWASVVMGAAGGRTQAGNRIVVGTDPVFHSVDGGRPDAAVIIQDGIDYAGVQPGRTGVYFDASCEGSYNQPASTLATLALLSSGTGSWSQDSGPPCGGSVSLIASNPAFSSLTTGDLAGWGCSVHESFPTFPSDWSALAVATDTSSKPTCGIDPGNSTSACGEAYILIAGSSIVVVSGSISMSPLTGTGTAGTSHTVTANVTSGGSPLVGQAVAFTVTGQNTGATGTCVPVGCVSDSSGNVSFTYTDTHGAGDDTIKGSFTDAGGSLQAATAEQTWSGPLVPSQPMIINIPAPGAATYGSSFIAQVATTGDGVTSVTTNTPGICTVGTDGLTVSYLAAGTCSLTAHVAEGATYGAADGAPQTFTVSPAPLLVTASSESSIYGTTPGPITASYSGLVNGDLVPATLPTCSTVGTSSSPVGTYATSCSGGADPNYSITYHAGVLTVTPDPAPLSVKANNASMTYGGTYPALSAHFSGLVGADTTASENANTTCTSAVASSPIGTYPINCTTTDPDYSSITYTAGTLTVTSAGLTVTASPESSTYGSTPGQVNPLYSGFVNGDTAASLTKAPTCSSSVTSSSSVGTHTGADACVNAVDANYTISYVAASATVSPAILIVSATSESVPYGSVPGPISAFYIGFVNGDNVASLTSAASCPAVAGGAAGFYPTVCGGAVDPNYSIVYIGGELTVTPAAGLNVTANNASMVYGGAYPVLGAAFSGLVAGDSSAAENAKTNCTSAAVNAAAGSYPITCVTIDSNYSPIHYTAGTLTINQAPLSIAASSSTFTYGASVPAVTPSYSGFVNGETVASLTHAASCTTSTASPSSVGVHATSCSGAVDGNYAITYVAGTATVTPAALVILASSGSASYGGAVPAITASYSGFVAGDDHTALGTQPSCVTSASSSSPVGSYATSCSGAVDANYSITYVDGSVSISPVVLTITAPGSTSTYGTPPGPVAVASYSGFANGDTAASLTITPTCSTTVNVATPAGTYSGADTCNGALDPNYLIQYVPGTATVNQAALTITASSESSVYGSTPHAVTASSGGSYTGFVGNDSVSSLSVAPSCSVAVTPATAVGSYPGATSCSGAVDGNYAITYVAGTATVTPAALVITASSGSASYGGAVPPITASYSGFVPGDDNTALGTQPSCGTGATSSSPVGSYATSCSGALDGNYSITYVGGSVSISPVVLTITAADSTSTYGSPAGPVAVASYSGFANGDTAASLTITPTCSTTVNVATPAGTYSGADTCNGALDPNYLIQYVAGTATVNQAALTITASPESSVYGSAPNLVTSSLADAYTGFVNNDSASSLAVAPTCSVAVSTLTPVGSYPGATSCGGAVDGNYAITYVSGTATVTPAALVISASSGLASYGGAVPAITASYSGFVAGDDHTALGTQPSCGTGATSFSPVGSYATSCSGAVDANYSITYVGGSVSISPVVLTITAPGSTSTYGTPPASLAEPTYSGFVGVDGSESLTITPTCSTTVNVATPAGTYSSADTCNGALDPNYLIQYVAGTATVNQAALTITASPESSVYGSAPNLVTSSLADAYTGFVNNDSASSLAVAPTCSVAVSTLTPVGSYPGATSCGGAVDGNYAITYVPGTATVTPAALVIAAANTTSTYGDFLPPPVAASYSGFQNAESATALTTQPTCVSTVNAATHAGSYLGANTCAGATDPNYTISYASGNATVAQAALLVTASSDSSTYGSAPGPATVASYTGFKDGDTAASLLRLPACATSITSATPAGTYNGAETCSGAIAFDYTINYAAGTATVKKAGLVITASSVTSVYGTAPGAVTVASYSSFVNNDTATSLTTPASCTTSVIATSPAGTYPAADTCSGAVDPNYTITYVGATETVNKAQPSLVVTGAEPATFGTPATYSVTATGTGAGATPTGTVTLSDGAGGTCTVTLVAGSGSCTISRDTGGVYVVTATYNGNANYLTAAGNTALDVFVKAPCTCDGFYGGGTAGCQSLLADPSPAANGVVGAGQAMTIVYTGASAIGSGSSAPSAVLSNGMDLPITVTSTSGQPLNYVDSNGGPASSAHQDLLSFTIPEPLAQGSYAVQITVHDTNGHLDQWTWAINVGPPALVITASSSTTTYGQAPAPVTVSYAGFLNGDTPASLTTAPTCATTVTSTSAAGTYTGADTCSGAVDPHYTIVYAAGNATVNKAALTITASGLTSAYGGTHAAVTASYSGFVNSGTTASLTTLPTCSTTVAATTPAGAYPGADTCNGAAAANYAISYVAGNATVTKVALTITASSLTSTYGSKPGSVSASYTGFVNGDSAGALATQPTCSTTVTATSPAGTYAGADSCSGAASGNYTIAYVAGNATVTRAALTITASNSVSTHGTAPGPITASYTGFVAGNTAASLTTAPTCTTTVTSATHTGTYNGANTCSGAVDANYTISYLAGNATVH